MTFADIRTKFIEMSGRGDFPDSAGSKAEFFIKAGYDYLSSLVPRTNWYSEVQHTNGAGKYQIDVSEARAVKTVHWSDNGTYVPLTKITNDEFKALYNDNQTTGTPVNWSPWFSKGDVEGTGIMIGPMPEGQQDFVIVILPFDRFHSSTDWAEAGKSWLSNNYPDLIIQAALYKLETFYRNIEGAKGWNEGLKEAVRQIDFDIVEQETAEVSTMTEQYKLDRRL